MNDSSFAPVMCACSVLPLYLHSRHLVSRSLKFFELWLCVVSVPEKRRPP
jgi:hypothetical protein